MNLKKYYSVMCLLISAMLTARIPIDRTLVVIHTDGDPVMLTESEIELSLDGKPRSLDERIFEHLMVKEGQMFGLEPKVEETWEKIKQQNKMSERDMDKLVKSAGYTIEEAKAELGRMSMVNQILGFRVQAQVFVPKKDVVAYYNQHPEYRQAEYFIAHANVPYNGASSKQELFNQLQAYRDGKAMMQISWSKPFWLQEDEVAADKLFIQTMKPGAISEPIESYNGYELIKLIDKHEACLVSLQERYNQIEYQLKMPKFEQELERYKRSLFSKATIVYL